MISFRRFSYAIAAVVLATIVGCGGSGPKYVKVTGVVTLDGKPYKNALVSFQPIAEPGKLNAGVGSGAVTDAEGKFALQSQDGKPGAVVGKHRIRIQTKRDDPTAYVDPSVGSPDDPNPTGKKQLVDPIPLEWYADTSTKEFIVPPEGTDKAEFAIQTKKK